MRGFKDLGFAGFRILGLYREIGTYTYFWHYLGFIRCTTGLWGLGVYSGIEIYREVKEFMRRYEVKYRLEYL